jgi:Na+/H+ antiporter NhaD/arsenite permease-like protein
VSITFIFILIFVLILILLVTGRYHRSVAALLGALLMIIFGVQYGLFHIEGIWVELVSLIDINTVVLVIGVMILAEALARSGFFEFVGLSLAKTVGGSFHRISLTFITLSILFSALLSNITAMVIIGALTISLAKKYGADPRNTILYEAVVTDVGGLTLMISSIPNLIVASELNIGFIEFALIAIPLTIFVSVASLLLIDRWMRDDDVDESDLEIDPWSVVKNKAVFYRSAAIFLLVIILFIIQGFVNIPLGLIAIVGAIVMLIVGGEDPESIFSDVDWGTVFFLTSFYVIVGGLERSGVLAIFARDVIKVLGFHPGITSVANMWISAVTSSIVDNIPITLTLIPVIKQVSEVTGFSVKVLAWGIVYGANLGGNLTPIGSPSNIIALGILRKEGKIVSWGEWTRKCVPMALMQLLLASAYIFILFGAL